MAFGYDQPMKDTSKVLLFFIVDLTVAQSQRKNANLRAKGREELREYWKVQRELQIDWKRKVRQGNERKQKLGNIC